MQNYIAPLFLLIFFTALYSFFWRDTNQNIDHFSKSIYDYSAQTIDGDSVSISQYRGKKILIVNVASRCGFTPQYEELQVLSQQYKDEVEVLGFPANDFLWQEPANNNEIQQFCSTKYNVSFPMFAKIGVKKSKNQHPIYTWLSNKFLNGWNNQAPSWNFCKYLIDENGKLIQYYPSKTNPLNNEILKHLTKPES